MFDVVNLGQAPARMVEASVGGLPGSTFDRWTSDLLTAGDVATIYFNIVGPLPRGAECELFVLYEGPSTGARRKWRAPVKWKGDRFVPLAGEKITELGR